jgi:uncharacterized protein YcbK (DUF882 family)
MALPDSAGGRLSEKRRITIANRAGGNSPDRRPEFMPARRRLLGAGMAITAGLLLGPAPAIARLGESRRLQLFNLHTHERCDALYFAERSLIEHECRALDHLLRDFRTGDVIEMDRELFHFLHELQRSVGVDGEFEVISGYRSPATNQRLREAGRGVAKASLHTQGKAVDIRLPGCGLSTLRDAARALELGGVGYYPKSDFIHIDTGRVRFW